MDIQLVQSILHRLGEKLPLRDDDVQPFKSNAIVRQQVTAIVEVAHMKLSTICKCLINLIENLPQTATFAKLFLLKLLLLCLQSAIDGNFSSPSLPADNKQQQRGRHDSVADSGIPFSTRSRSSLPTSTNIGQPVAALSLRESVASAVYSLAIRILASTEPPSDLQTREILLNASSDLLKTEFTAAEFYCTAGRLLFSISLSNWDLVYGKIKNSLYTMSQSPDEHAESAELRALEWINLNARKLSVLLQDLSFVIKSFKKQVVLTLPPLLRKAIWNWINLHPQEFIALHMKRKRLEGVSDSLFEHFNELADNNKRKNVVLPFQTALVILCPDVLASIISTSYDIASSNKIIFPFAFVMENLRLMLKGKLFEVAAICYVDFCKASVTVSQIDSALKKIADDVDQELREKLFSVSTPFVNSDGLVDTALMIDFFVASFRRNSDNFIKLSIPIFLPASVPMVFRLVLVKSCLIMSSQERGTNPPASLLWPLVAPTLKALLDELLRRDFVTMDSRRSSPSKKLRKEDDNVDKVDLLISLLKLLKTDPLCVLWSDKEDAKFHENKRIISNITLALQDGSLVRRAAADAIVELHQPKYIRMWGPRAHLSYTFWVISSSVTSSVASLIFDSQQKLSGVVLEILDTLLKLLVIRNEHVQSMEERALAAPEIAERNGCASAVEAAILIYLCSNESDITTLSLACLQEFCLESSLVAEIEDQSQLHNVKIYRQFLEDVRGGKGKGGLKMIGRVALQKKFRKMLRSLENVSNGILKAWEEGYRRWNVLDPMKRQSDDVPLEQNEAVPAKKKHNFLPLRSAQHISNSFTRVASGSFVNPVGDVPTEDKGDFQNYSGFLCSLGGCCMTLVSDKRGTVKKSADALSLSQILATPVHESMDVNKTDVDEHLHKFIEDIFEMLVCDNAVLRESIKELVGAELSTGLFSLLFMKMDILHLVTSSDGELVCSERSTFHVEQSISVVRLILDRTVDRVEELSSFDFGSLFLSYIKYLNKLGRGGQALKIKVKMCQLVDSLMQKREMINLREEIVLRNRLLETFVEWTSEFSIVEYHGGEDQQNQKLVRDLDIACVRNMVTLLNQLPLQPTDLSADADVAGSRSRLFTKYLQFFIQLLRKCRVETNGITNDMSSQEAPKDVANLKEHAIMALSNLLSANIDCGLKYAISVGYHEDPKTRTAFMHVLTNILNQGTEFDGLTDADTADPLNALVQTLYEPNLSVTLAICEVCDSSDVDMIGNLLYNIFESRNQVMSLLFNVIQQECRKAESTATLFRRNSVATKVMATYAKGYCTDYLRSTLDPVWQDLSAVNTSRAFEIDPTRLVTGDDVAKNLANLKWLSSKFLEAIVRSIENAPPPIRHICAFLSRAVVERFPEANMAVVIGGFIFLRFFCPAIVSPEGLDFTPTADVRRGLILVTKIIQNISNTVQFGGKEAFMVDLNEFLVEKTPIVMEFLQNLASSDFPGLNQAVEVHPLNSIELSQLHSYIYKQKEALVRVMMSSRSQPGEVVEIIQPEPSLDTAIADFTSLVESLGVPAERQGAEYSSAQSKASANLFYVTFMQKNEGRNLDEVKALRFFYEGGLTKANRHVFYFVPRKLLRNTVDMEAVIYIILMIIKPYQNKPFEVVVDLSAFAEENEIENQWLTQFVQVAPVEAVANLSRIMIYNANSDFKKFAKSLQRLVSGKITKRIVFINSLNEFNEYISPIDLRLPKFTLALEQDVTTFSNILRGSGNRQSAPVTFRLNPEHLQIVSTKKAEIFGLSAIINDIYPLSDLDDVLLATDRNTADEFVIKFDRGSNWTTFANAKREQIVTAILHARSKALTLTPNKAERVIRPSDVPGTLLNMALLNMGSGDPGLRQASYYLLSSLCMSFNFNAGLRLISCVGLYVPANSAAFVVNVSQQLAVTAPQLTFEFLKECFVGFEKSDFRMKHATLEYMAPWLPNISKATQVVKRDHDFSSEIRAIIRSLIDITVKESELYPSLQSIIWLNLAREFDLVDEIFNGLLEVAVERGLFSPIFEIISGTFITLSSVNVHTFAAKIVYRLRMAIKHTHAKNVPSILEHPLWPEITVLLRLALMLSFHGQINVEQMFPDVVHIICMLVSTGSMLVRSSVHSFAINILQSICSLSEISEQQRKSLNMIIAQYSDPKYRLLFGVNRSESSINEMISLSSLETIVKSFLEVTDFSSAEVETTMTRKARWMSLSTDAAFQYNASLQPRAFIELGCLSQGELDEDLVFQILSSLKGALDRFDEMDSTLIVSIVMCLTSMASGNRDEIRYLRQLFWLACAIVQMGHIPLFVAGVNLLHVVVNNLSGRGHFLQETPQSFFMRAREDGLEQECLAIENVSGVSFNADFAFALGSILMKGVRNPATKAQTVASLSSFLDISQKFLLNISVTPRSDGDATLYHGPLRTPLTPKVETENTLFHVKHRGLVSLSVLGYLAPILPVMTIVELRDLLWAMCVNVDALDIAINLETDQDLCDQNGKYVGPSIMKLIEPMDASSVPMLMINSLVCSLENAEHERELVFLYNVLSEFSSGFPDFMHDVYPRLLHKLMQTVSNSHSPQVLDAVQRILYQMSSTTQEVDDEPVTLESASIMTKSKTNLSAGHMGDSNSRLNVENLSNGIQTITRSLTMKSMSKRHKLAGTVSGVEKSTPSGISVMTLGSAASHSRPSTPSIPNAGGFFALQNMEIGNFNSVRRNAKYSIAKLTSELIDAMIK